MASLVCFRKTASRTTVPRECIRQWECWVIQSPRLKECNHQRLYPVLHRACVTGHEYLLVRSSKKIHTGVWTESNKKSSSLYEGNIMSQPSTVYQSDKWETLCGLSIYIFNLQFTRRGTTNRFVHHWIIWSCLFHELQFYGNIGNMRIWLSLYLCLKNICSSIQFAFTFSALIKTEIPTLEFLSLNPVDALLAIEISHKEYLLIFNSKFSCGSNWLLSFW